MNFRRPFPSLGHYISALLLLLISTASLTAADKNTPDAVLDRLHVAASAADGDTYFALFTADAVFLGTDATERWPIKAFRKFAKPYFDAGKGWTYIKTQRHINISENGAHASFDELLENASYGLCRGSGVLRLVDGKWKIEQYHLTIPIPNDLAREFVDQIREAEAPATGKP